MNNIVKYKILDNRIGTTFEFPNYGKKGNAGIDLRAMLDTPSIILNKNKFLKIKTGIAIEMPETMVGLIIPRSGLGVKGLNIMNTIGIIDSNYRGELVLSVKYQPLEEQNSNDLIVNDHYTINVGDRLCQLLFMPVYTVNLLKVEDLSISNRNDSGFGSSGVK